jgi:hypothetical protein
MPSYNLSTRGRVADIVAGLRVDKAAVSVAGASTKSLFTVAGGNCIIVGLVGESTTGQAAGANAAKYISTPTVGTAVDMCATGDIVSAEIGALYTITGVLATAAVISNGGCGAMMWAPICVAPGVIGFNTAGNTAGSWKFSIWYVPAEDGAYIAAA